jgi:hypothetical protein
MVKGGRARRLRERGRRGLRAEALPVIFVEGRAEYSFVDATSFAVMRSLRVREALAFDGDFAAAGFTEAMTILANETVLTTGGFPGV